MAKFIHSMVRVLDLDKSIDFYNKAFGFVENHRLDFTDFTLVYLLEPESGFELELTLNKDQKIPYTHGSGYGHIAVTVEDLAQVHQRFTEQGFEPGDLVDFAPDGDRIAHFFFCKDPDGYEIEVLQRHGHYQ